MALTPKMVLTPKRGEIYWADLLEPVGSRPAYRRPVLVIQDNSFNASKLSTVIILNFTTNLQRTQAEGNVFIAASESGLPKDSVANVTQLYTINKLELTDRISQLSETLMDLVDDGLKLVLGLKR
jgi:mRNA interferase MazF